MAAVIADIKDKLTNGSTKKKVGGRTAIIGTGSRGQMYLRGSVERNNPVVALCDSNAGRVQLYNRLLGELGQPAAAEYDIAHFEEMLDKEKVEVLVVTTVDATHHQYIIPALKRGIQVVTEKPMCTTIDSCKAILRATEETNNHVAVTFNYRYNPTHERVKTLIAKGTIGDVISVHFEWLLDTVHGCDYFRRWHRQKDNSGGLMVHKSGHHFDLVNWWVDSQPSKVFGMGKLAFYGDGKTHGYGKSYSRAYGNEEAAKDPFAIHLEKDPVLKELYIDQESHDGYIRDMNPFAPGIGIEDDMSVLVKYKNDVTMTYHLTAYSPWEGYRVMFNGSKGRLELEVVESTHRLPDEPSMVGPGSIHGVKPQKNFGPSRISVHPLWEKSYEIDLGVIDHAGHGGGDARLLSTIFGPLPGKNEAVDEASQMSASEKDGAYALAVGLAANQSFVTGQMVDCEAMLRL